MSTSLVDARLGLQTALATLNSNGAISRARPSKRYAPAEQKLIRRRFHRTVSGVQRHHTEACVDSSLPNAAALAAWLLNAWPLPGQAPDVCHVCPKNKYPDATVFVTTEDVAEDDFYKDWWHLKLPALGVVFLIRSKQ